MEYSLEGFEIPHGTAMLRRWPEMYLGTEGIAPPWRVQLLEGAVREILEGSPSEIRILLWRMNTITLAYDGAPMPVEPLSPHPRTSPTPHSTSCSSTFLSPKESASVPSQCSMPSARNSPSRPCTATIATRSSSPEGGS